MSTLTENELKDLKDFIVLQFKEVNERIDKSSEQVNTRIDKLSENLHQEIKQLSEDVNNLRVEVATARGRNLMSEKPKTGLQDGYQAKIDKPPGKPPTGGSNVKPPSNSSKKT